MSAHGVYENTTPKNIISTYLRYLLFISYHHHQWTYPVPNAHVLPARRNTAELDPVGEDMSNQHLFADIHTNSHSHTCVYSQLMEKIFQWSSFLSENVNLLGLKQLVRHSSFVKYFDRKQTLVMAWCALWAASSLAWSPGYLPIFSLQFFIF